MWNFGSTKTYRGRKKLSKQAIRHYYSVFKIGMQIEIDPKTKQARYFTVYHKYEN